MNLGVTQILKVKIGNMNPNKLYPYKYKYTLKLFNYFYIQFF